MIGNLGVEAERTLHPVGAVGYFDGRLCYCLACSPHDRRTASAGLCEAVYPEDGPFRCFRCGAAVNRPTPLPRTAIRADTTGSRNPDESLKLANGWPNERSRGFRLGGRAARLQRPYLALSEGDWASSQTPFAVGYRDGYRIEVRDRS